MDKKKWLIIAFFLLIALATRFYMAIVDDAPLEKDPLEMDEIAQSIVKGEGIRNRLGEVSAYRPPLYLHFLALNYKIFGHSLLAVRMIQAVLSVLTVIVIGLIAYRIFGPWCGVISLAISSVYPPFIDSWVSCNNITYETLYTFLLVTSIYTMTLFFYRSSRRMAVLSGFFWGLATLCRSEPLLLLPFLPFALILFGFKWREVFSYCLIAFTAAVLVLMPWTVRNYRLFRTFVPITTYGGVALYVSNHPGSDGFGNAFFRSVILPEDLRLKELGVNEAERERMFRLKALDYIRKNPGEFFLLFLKKCRFYLDINHTYYYRDGTSKRVVNWGYILVSIMSVAGFFLGLRDRDYRKWVLMLAFIFGLFFLTHTLVIVSHHYRCPTEPLLIILATYALYSVLHGGMRQRKLLKTNLA